MAKEASAQRQTFAADEIHTILGPESAFEGKLVFTTGTIRIDGNFKGEVRTQNTLIIGETAR
ncbi:MAG: polymer-forming cytoskeletal protein [Myxococcota bacterium]